MSGYPLARSEGLVTEAVDDDLVVYVEGTQTAHALSKDAASVWRQCDGRSSAADIARRLGLDEARAAQALDELSGAELLLEPDGISRRALYKRTAKLGAAALGAQLIYSVAIPAASAAQSSTCGPFFGSTCVLFYDNGTCQAPANEDTCTVRGAPAGCTCHPTSACTVVTPDILSTQNGECM